jgi:hypothetical protein
MSKQKNRHMVMRPLKCQLTDEEVDAKSAELARVTMDERAMEDAIAKIVDDHKLEKKKLDKGLAEMSGNRAKLAQEITSRTVERDVPCDWRFDLANGTAILVRRDTEVAVIRRDMTEDERQLKIGETLEAATAEQLALWEQQLAAAPQIEEPQNPEEIV